MSDYQIEIFTGNLGKDPESRFTPAGQQVTSFSVGSNREYTASNGEKVKETVWRRVSAWGKLAEVCSNYLKKGSRVLVEGRLVPDKATGNPRIWTTSDGKAAANFEVVASSVTFLSPKTADSMVQAAQNIGGEIQPEEEVPF